MAKTWCSARRGRELWDRWTGSVVVVDPETGRILSIVNQKLALGSGFHPLLDHQGGRVALRR